MKIRCVKLLLCFYLPQAGAAVADLKVDLQQTVQQGVQFSPEIKKAQAELDAAEALTDQRKGLLFPKIDLYATAKLKKDPSRFSSSSSANDEDYDTSLKLIQPLYRGGSLSNGISSYKLNQEIYAQQLFNTRQVAVAALINAYYDLAQSEQELIAVEEHLNVLKEYSSIVTRYEQNGRSRRMDRLQAVVNLSLTNAEQVRLSRARKNASDSLKRLIGLLTVEDSKNLSVGEKINEKVNLITSQPVVFAKAMVDVEQHNPELRVVALKREKTKYDNAMEMAEDRPELNLEGSYGYRAGESPEWLQEPSHYYAVGLSLKIPLFSGLTSLSKHRVHSEQLKQVERSFEIKLLDLRERLEQAIVAQNSEAERLTLAQTASRQGREALQLANTAFGRGVASTQDVLNAQGTRYATEKLLIESQFSYLRAQLNLRQLMGVDLQQHYAAVNR